MLYNWSTITKRNKYRYNATATAAAVVLVVVVIVLLVVVVIAAAATAATGIVVKRCKRKIFRGRYKMREIGRRSHSYFVYDWRSRSLFHTWQRYHHHHHHQPCICKGVIIIIIINSIFSVIHWRKLYSRTNLHASVSDRGLHDIY